MCKVTCSANIKGFLVIARCYDCRKGASSDFHCSLKSGVSQDTIPFPYALFSNTRRFSLRSVVDMF